MSPPLRLRRPREPSESGDGDGADADVPPGASKAVAPEGGSPKGVVFADDGSTPIPRGDSAAREPTGIDGISHDSRGGRRFAPKSRS